MRKDLGKVLTESPRRGSRSQNLKTGFHEHGHDIRETKEDHYSLPKRGKMLMNSRDFGAHSEEKEFTDVLGPLKKWAEAQVGRNWDKVYSEIRKGLPNNNKQNHHLIDTHLPQYIASDVEVVKTPKGRKVYDRKNTYYSHGEPRELSNGDIYVDPVTHILMKYKGGKSWAEIRNGWRQKKLTETGFYIDDDNVIDLEKGCRIEKRGSSWVYCRYDNIECALGLSPILMEHHTLSKKELKHYGIQHDNKV